MRKDFSIEVRRLSQLLIGCLLPIVVSSCVPDSPTDNWTANKQEENVRRTEDALTTTAAVRFASIRRAADVELVRSALRERGREVPDDKLDTAVRLHIEGLRPRARQRLLERADERHILRERVRVRLETEALIETALGAPISEEEIRAYYNAQPHYLGAESFVYREVVLLNETENNVARLKALQQSVESGTPMAVIAARHSHADTARRGGVSDRRTKDTVNAAIWGALETMRDGELRVVETIEAAVLIQRLAKRPARKASVDAVRDEIIANLRLRRHSALIAQELASLRAIENGKNTDNKRRPGGE